MTRDLTPSQKNPVWLSLIRRDTTKLFGFSCTQDEVDEDAFVLLIREGKAGHKNLSSAFPETMWIDKTGQSDVSRLPDFFSAAGLLTVSAAFAEILRDFDLGASSLHPVAFLKSNKKTPIAGDYFFLHLCEHKEAFDPETSRNWTPNMFDHPFIKGSPSWEIEDGDISVHASALQGPDLWMDRTFLDSVFVSDRLRRAIRDTRSLKNIKLTGCSTDRASA